MNSKKISLQPYISIDLETTGLNLGKSQILQIAAIYDDGTTLVDKLITLNIYINQQITYVELDALVMHEKTKIFSKIQEANKAKESKKIGPAIDTFLDFIDVCRTPNGFGSKYKMTLGGKNASTYDIPVLKNWMSEEQLERFNELVYHSVIDVGSIYFQDFGRIPSLTEILKQLQISHGITREEVTHNALYDALDVVTAIRSRI